MRRGLLLLALGLLAAALVPGIVSAQGSPETKGGGGPPGCATTSGPATLSNVSFKKPGGQFESATGKICWFFEYSAIPVPPAPRESSRAQISGATALPQAFVGFTTLAFDQDLTPVLPKGTVISFDVTLPGVLFSMFTSDNPVASINNQTISVQGETTPVKFGFTNNADGSPNCNGPTDSFGSFFGGLVAGTPTASPRAAGSGADDSLDDYKGSFFGTNAQNNTLPTVSADGQTVELEIAGCGDNDPTTEDGFFKGFLTVKGTQNMKLNKGFLDQLPGKMAADKLDLLLLEDNGIKAPGGDVEFTIKKEGFNKVEGLRKTASSSGDKKGVAGIFIDFKTSFSSHTLVTEANTKKVKKARKVAKRCKEKGSKLKLAKKGKKRVLKCKGKKN